ncbi:hypothetical protein CA264_03295 [Pontibacter actiniarum]|uniref:Solute-binding protein family 3/N-terminal domain-containing protein n=2 Tax=Pontibacter actiniarum TaxID=323450 RepID=A0A1X9YNW5_9BACT|nr:hypothetical protein CA264_03295 [Pontibacter actiniarum]
MHMPTLQHCSNRLLHFFVLGCFLLLVGCDNYPRDPEHTLENVKGHVLRVGVASNGKWAQADGASPSGIEVELVKGFAKELGAEIEWLPDAQSNILEKVEVHELDMAIGGFTKTSPWVKHLAFSQPHHTEKIKVGTLPSRTLPEEIEDLPVHVRRNSQAAVYVKKKEGQPVYVDQLQPGPYLVAATEEELQQLGLRVSDYTLHKEEYVVAIPKGENAFLMRLDKYIDKHSHE